MDCPLRVIWPDLRKHGIYLFKLVRAVHFGDFLGGGVRLMSLLARVGRSLAASSGSSFTFHQ